MEVLIHPHPLEVHSMKRPLVILLAIAGFRWRNRLKFGVRRPMMARPTTGHKGPYHGGWFAGPYADGWKGSFNVSDKDRPRGPANAPRRR